MAIDVADIKTEYGAYYLNHGQNQKDLTKVLNWTAETDELFTKVRTDDTVIRKGSSQLTRVLQAFQKQFTPLGDLAFKPHPINLHHLKVDVQEYPDDLEKSWLAFLESENVDRKTWPFVKWWIKQVTEKEMEDFELYEAFLGVRTEPTAGTAGGANEGIDGIRKLINDGITATTITPINTGALSSDAVTFVEQIEAFVAQIDKRYRRMPMELAMSIDNEDLFKEGMDLKYNAYTRQESDLRKVRRNPNIMVRGLRSWDGSDKLFCTPKMNAICGVKWERRTPLIESDMRLVKMSYDYWKGYGFLLHELVFTNDQDLV